jgi:hypothetical protein
MELKMSARVGLGPVGMSPSALKIASTMSAAITMVAPGKLRARRVVLMAGVGVDSVLPRLLFEPPADEQPQE